MSERLKENKKLMVEDETTYQGAEPLRKKIWVGSVALLAGFAGLYFGSMALFRLGVPMSPWHGIFFAASALAASLSMKPGRGGWAIWLGCLVVTAAAAALASPFHDFSWDGMGARQGMVEALVGGGTPRFSPAPHVLSAWIVSLTGQINAGKAVNLLAAVAAFGTVFRFLWAVGLRVEWAWVGAAVAALNPVFVYQLSSYYIDGFTGSLLACLVSAYGLVYLSPQKVKRWMFLGLVLSLVASAKVSGLGYSMILGVGFFGALLAKKGWTMPKILGIGAAFVGLALIALFSHLLERGETYNLSRLISVTDLKTPHFGVGGFSCAPVEAAGMSKIEVFVRSHFAPTRTMSLYWDWKFPFWFNRPELSLFEDLNSDPRSGGFGPLYGGVFIFAFLAFLIALFRMTIPWVAWVPALGILVSCLLSQTWWARWVPQGWLVPMAFAVPVLTLRPMGLAGGLARASIAVGLLNSILIFAFYMSGCFQNQAVLTRQLAFLKNMPQPLNVYIPSFQSNETWLKEAGLRFKKIDQEPPMPRLKLQRTNSKVQLPSNWTNIPVSNQTLQEWQRRELIETK